MVWKLAERYIFQKAIKRSWLYKSTKPVYKLFPSYIWPILMRATFPDKMVCVNVTSQHFLLIASLCYHPMKFCCKNESLLILWHAWFLCAHHLLRGEMPECFLVISYSVIRVCIQPQTLCSYVYTYIYYIHTSVKIDVKHFGIKVNWKVTVSQCIVLQYSMAIWRRILLFILVFTINKARKKQFCLSWQNFSCSPPWSNQSKIELLVSFRLWKCLFSELEPTSTIFNFILICLICR